MNQALQQYDDYAPSFVVGHTVPVTGNTPSHRESMSTLRNDSCDNIEALCEALNDSLRSENSFENPEDATIGSASSFCDDPLIGCIICVPSNFDFDSVLVSVTKRTTRQATGLPSTRQACGPPLMRTLSKDTPISLSASGRNVSTRRNSLSKPSGRPIARRNSLTMSIPIRRRGDSVDEESNENERIHPRVDSHLSLPALAFSWEDRFAGSTATTKGGKVDKLMPTPVKRRRDFVNRAQLRESISALSPMLF